jgi:hypothetical protein
MPARAERIFIYPAEEGQSGQVMRFPLWWDRRGFFEKYRDREIDTGHPIYVDYALLLTPWEALEWDKRCREEYLSDVADKSLHVLPDMERMESALKKARWVIVESYEWESGMD